MKWAHRTWKEQHQRDLQTFRFPWQEWTGKNSATTTVNPEFIWILRIFCWKQFKAWKHRSKRNCVELCVNLPISWVITWDIYSNKKHILYKLYVCIFIPIFNRNAACHNMRNVWTVTYKFLKQHPPYRNAQTPTAPEQCSQPLLHSILPIADSTGFYHQEFQVPTMEVLNLIRLFWGWVFTYISLTYSLYRWVPPF